MAPPQLDHIGVVGQIDHEIEDNKGSVEVAHIQKIWTHDNIFSKKENVPPFISCDNPFKMHMYTYFFVTIWPFEYQKRQCLHCETNHLYEA